MLPHLFTDNFTGLVYIFIFWKQWLTTPWTELEQISAAATGSTTLSVPISGIGSRHMSSGEIKYLERLVKKYEDDVEGMTQDRKLNPEQRTVGQLRRALRNFRMVVRWLWQFWSKYVLLKLKNTPVTTCILTPWEMDMDDQISCYGR